MFTSVIMVLLGFLMETGLLRKFMAKKYKHYSLKF